MVKCPKCGQDNLEAKKEWHYGPRNDPRRMLVQNFSCSSCGTSYNAWVRPEKTTVRAIKGAGRKKLKK